MLVRLTPRDLNEEGAQPNFLRNERVKWLRFEKPTSKQVSVTDFPSSNILEARSSRTFSRYL